MGDLAAIYAASQSSSQSSVISDAGEANHGPPDLAIDKEDEIRVVSITPARDAAVDVNVLTAEQVEHSRSGDSFEDIRSLSASLEIWVKSALELRDRQGIQFTDNLRRNPKFQNPSVCAKMIAFCDLDEHGTNFKDGGSRSSSDLGHSAFYDFLRERQQKLAEEMAIKGHLAKNQT